MFQPKPLAALHFQQAILRVMNEKDPKWLLGYRGGFQDGHLESMFVDARNTQELPGLDTIEGWGGVHPIIVVTARDWARMRGRPLHVWGLRMWRYRNGFRSNDGKDWGGCVSGFQRIVVHGMDSGMRNFTSRLTTIHFPDSLAMARMGPIEVHVHQRRVSNCTGWWHPSKQLGRQSLERPSRLCACANEKGDGGRALGGWRESKSGLRIAIGTMLWDGGVFFLSQSPRGRATASLWHQGRSTNRSSCLIHKATRQPDLTTHQMPHSTVSIPERGRAGPL
ncbi:hypothetical protein M0657_006904 [Pyricularia oryzae]|nr:hypothetical protein M9X92_006514 [Pyricularia oryzae]KAI7919907.1 hypothetical protein M0657_006904 [Pyricularia oryzae]